MPTSPNPTSPDGSMVERVKLAMADAADWDLPHSQAHILARAAIEAMREPDMAMKLAGARQITAQMTGAGPPADYDAAHDSWNAMIDEALK